MVTAFFIHFFTEYALQFFDRNHTTMPQVLAEAFESVFDWVRIFFKFYFH